MKSAPLTLVARLGEDLNWWLDSSDDAPYPHVAGLLDPRQLAHLVEACARYEPYGLTGEQLASAFHLYAVQAEIETGRLRLLHNPVARLEDANDLFALPALDEDGDGAYPDFLDALIAAHVRKLNAARHYARPISPDDLQDELDAFQHDLYFRDATRHIFEEITAILQWDPAEWDDTTV